MYVILIMIFQQWRKTDITVESQPIPAKLALQLRSKGALRRIVFQQVRVKSGTQQSMEVRGKVTLFWQKVNVANALRSQSKAVIGLEPAATP